eukprot:269133-Alexandrium_andersonii.AAC.1
MVDVTTKGRLCLRCVKGPTQPLDHDPGDRAPLSHPHDQRGDAGVTSVLVCHGHELPGPGRKIARPLAEANDRVPPDYPATLEARRVVLC